MSPPRVALLMLMACACGESAAAKPSGQLKGAAASSTRKVELARVTSQKLGNSVLVSGTLAADEQVTVSVKVAGRLASIAVDLGSVVSRGQAIAQVEPTDYQLKVEQALSALGQARAQLGLAPEGDDAANEALPRSAGAVPAIDVAQTSLVQEAQATMTEARAAVERARSLAGQRLIAQAELDGAEANFVRSETAVAKARDEIRNRQAALRQRMFELRLARQQLADAVIRAPLDGIVQQRNALAGEYLAAGAPVATIVRVDPLRLRAEVPERDAPLVRSGQTVRVTLEGDAVQHIGTVVRLAPALSEQNRSLAIEAVVANPGNLRPGSFARAEIVMDAAAAVPAVPSSAIVTFAGIEKVIAVEHGKAVEKQVVTGRRSGPWTEISSGLELGDAVVIEPGNLQQGQPVTVTGGT